MTVTQRSTIQLVSDVVAARAVHRQLQPARSTEERKFALSIVTLFHNRHVGISPEVALTLARLLLSQSQQAEPPWRSVYDRLKRAAIALSGLSPASLNATEAATHGLVLHTSFRYTILRLALPVVASACRHMQQNALFCEDNDVVSLTEIDYIDYCQRLQTYIQAVADNETAGLPQMFWDDRALTLSSLSRQRGRVGLETLPLTKLPEAGAVLRLRPDLDEESNKQQRRVQLAQRRTMFHPRLTEAGTDGIKVTTRVEDLPHMLESEYLYPPIIRFDRIFNTGFSATKRPPQPIRLRDVIVAAIFPPDLADTAAGLFARACWFECLTRVAQMLQHAALSRSEVRTVEGNAYRHVRTHAMILQDLPDILARLDGGVNPIFRSQFWASSGWFPSYIDRRELFQPLPTLSPSLSGSYAGDIEGWLHAAWDDQRDHVRWHQTKTSTYRASPTASLVPRFQGFEAIPLQMDQYAFSYLMLFLPLELMDADNPDAYVGATWRSSFVKNVTGIGVTWVPRQIHQQGWQFAGDSVVPGTQWLKNADKLRPEKLAGLLVGAWLDDIREEIGRA